MFNLLFTSLQKVAQEFLLDCKRSSLNNSTQDVWYVGIHVRRTDYARHLKKMVKGKLVKAEYFNRAMERMEERLRQDFNVASKVHFLTSFSEAQVYKQLF